MTDAALRSAPSRAPSQARAREVLRLLEEAYGPLTWEPRLDPISELVFTILSQNTSDVNAEKAFRNLRQRFPSWEAVAQARPGDIAQAIWIGGLGHTKAPRINAILRGILERRRFLDLFFLKDTPLHEAKAWLQALPGIGPKTAAVVLCFSLGMPAMPVDTHVYRVARRLALIGPHTTVEQAHSILEQAVQPDQVYAFHVRLITHGRQVCKAQRPRCQQCVLERVCPSSRLRGGQDPPGGSTIRRRTPVQQTRP